MSDEGAVARIYTLNDPRTSDVRYVGMTVYPLQKRLQGHLRYKGKDHKSSWIKSLRALGLKPTITEIDVVAIEDRAEVEQRWITYYRELGADLTNGTRGGIGSLGLKHSKEAKERMSKARKGRPSPRKGSKLTPAQVEQMRQNTIRQFQDNPEARAAVSRVHKGKTISEAQKKAVSEATTKRWAEWRASGGQTSEETRARISAAAQGRNLGIKRTDETRAKISEIKRQWWAEKKAREAAEEA